MNELKLRLVQIIDDCNKIISESKNTYKINNAKKLREQTKIVLNKIHSGDLNMED